MRPVRRAVVLALVATLLASPLCAAPAPRRVADLTANESLLIRYVSAGCYHLQERVIVVRGGRDKSADVAAATKESVGMPRDRGGVVPLDGFDVNRLDRLLAFYRTPGRPRGCVIKERVTLTWMKRGAPVAIERFADESCLADRDPGRLSLRELVLRVGANRRH